MKIIVTGAAGFIGSHLCERLLEEEANIVIGIDAFVNSAERWMKERNINRLRSHPRFSFYNQNLLTIDWQRVLTGGEVVYHLAGIPGVRASWGPNFHAYVTNNIVVTQKLLEACRDHPIHKLIYASTSSVYGEKKGMVAEDDTTIPLSPYGVSKLTGEHLCRVYSENEGVPTVVLRYFTVFGPRQRSDMAFHRFIMQMMESKPITVFGDGQQTRDFTYISDCVAATAAVLHADDAVGQTINVGGKARASVLEVIRLIEHLMQQKASLDFLATSRGEPKHTWANIAKAERLLNYEPKIDLKTGLEKEISYVYQLYNGGKQ
ncbi:NAD-dependent epimerase/dehydratase family protein [Numidum massiliense]|uniref:NAD-dependent epimerase/dehydratase family protein n=1 Tax=Numidum massiliense TaxID=1522315 RepID=UPI0006D5B6F2|nr:NAD-dependent epimerase/dehydratase family protein [Numidum massiliense]